MSKLVNLDDSQHAHDIHHGRIKLKTVVGGTDVVADAEEALSKQGQAHGIEDAQLLQDAFARLMIVLGLLLVRQLPSLDPDQANEGDAIHHEGDIGDDMIEIGKDVERLGTFKVVVAKILGTGQGLGLLDQKDKLNAGDEVEE